MADRQRDDDSKPEKGRRWKFKPGELHEAFLRVMRRAEDFSRQREWKKGSGSVASDAKRSLDGYEWQKDFPEDFPGRETAQDGRVIVNRYTPNEDA